MTIAEIQKIVGANPDGIMGPQTRKAIADYQKTLGVTADGIWGPMTNDAYLEKTVYKPAIEQHPVFQQLSAENGVNVVNEALTSGDWSGLGFGGKPFSDEDQKKAEEQGMKDVEGAFKAKKEYETAKAESDLAQKQADYQDYLIKSGENFQAEKTGLDQDSANKGVLFSGGRAQKEKQLQSAYAGDQATKLRNLGSYVGDASQGYAYKYGSDAANGLSKYYSAGGNTYNANVANGGVGSSGLSNIYNPTGSYQGTEVNANRAAGQQRAAGYLWNKANKLFASGYKTQY